MGKLKDLTIDIESGPDMVINGKAFDIKTNAGLKDMCDSLDALRYSGKAIAVTSGRRMGKSLALGMMYGVSTGRWSGKMSMWELMKQHAQEIKEQKLADETELGAILYGKE